MSGGIDEYKGREFDWAVDTVIENANEMGLLDEDEEEEADAPGATFLVNAVWEFVIATFKENDLIPPNKIKLIAAVKNSLS